MEGPTKNWVGTKLEDIHHGQGPWSFPVSTVIASRFHSVLYELPPSLEAPPKPHVNLQMNHWDNDHVRMPYSSKNLFPAKNSNGSDILKKRWEIIEEALLQPITTVHELELAIRKYNIRLPKLLALQYLFEEVLDQEEGEQFFKHLLPGIIRLALQLPEILPGNLPLLKKGTCKSISLSQFQIASLLANAFLCTFPWRKDLSAYPGVNFSGLFSSHLRPDFDNAVVEKLKCICHYFRRVLKKEPVGVITFERKYFPRSTLPKWDSLKNNLGNTRVHISSTGYIEDDGHGLLQVDFANKYVGGGVLGFGCVQEEIRFVICPELIISRLFTEQLGPTEALVIIGSERFSKYEGYGDTFTWAGNYNDSTPYDSYGRRRTAIVAIDALYFGNPVEQYNSSCILREVNKAYVGFHSRLDVQLPAVATGNWGCGAFHGDPNLKSLLQLMACSAARRDLVYFTFGDVELRDRIHEMYLFLATNQVTICQLWRYLHQFSTMNLKSKHLFAYIQQAHFDSKNQLSIKSYFGLNKKKSDKGSCSNFDSNSDCTRNYPNALKDSSLSEELSEIIIESSQPYSISDSDVDVIESSQNEDLSISLAVISQQINTKLCNKNDYKTTHLAQNNETIVKSCNEEDFKKHVETVANDNVIEASNIDATQTKMDLDEDGNLNGGLQRKITDYFIKKG